MTSTEIHNLATAMLPKMAIINRAVKENDIDTLNNMRKFPFYSEFRGMVQTLKALGIDYEVHFDKDCRYMTAIEIEGIKFAVPHHEGYITKAE